MSYEPKDPIEVAKDLYPKLPAIKEHAEFVGTERALNGYAMLEKLVGRLITQIQSVEQVGTDSVRDAQFSLYQYAADYMAYLETTEKRQSAEPKPEKDYVAWLRSNPKWLDKSAGEIAQKLAREGIESPSLQAINKAKKKIAET